MTMKTEQIMAQAKKATLRQPKDRRLQRSIMEPPVRMLPAMPIAVMYDPMRVVVSFERQGEDVLFRFRFADTGPGYVENLIDAYKVRETFLDVRTPGEALDFLNFTGHFQHLREREEEQVHETLTWSDFRRWQEVVRIVLRDGALKLEEIRLSGKSRGIQFVVPEHLRPILSFPNLSTTESCWLNGYPNQIVIRAEGEPLSSSGERSSTLRSWPTRR